MTLFDGELGPHKFKPGACAECGRWHTNEIHIRAVDAPVDPVGREHPETAKRQGRRMAPRLGTIRRAAYERIRQCGSYGATAKEVGVALGLESKHQSYSPAVSTLKADGWIRTDLDITGKPRTRDGAEVMVIARDVL